MPRDGSGNYTRTDGFITGSTVWGTAANTIKKIFSGRHDTHDQDLADALTASLAKDGQTTMTGNLKLGNNRVTGVSAGTARTDCPTIAQIQDASPIYAGSSTNSGNAYSVALTPSITSYTSGLRLQFVANATNTGSATLNVNAVGAVTLADQFGTALPSGTIRSGQLIDCVYYTGATFRVINLPFQGDILSKTMWGGTSTNSGNAFSISLSPSINAYTTGMMVAFIANTANTGATTLNVNGVGATAVRRVGGATALLGGEFTTSQLVIVVYDGTVWRMVSHSDEAWSTWTPTYNSVTAGLWASVTTVYARYCLIGKQCKIQIYAGGTTSGAPTRLTFTAPVTNGLSSTQSLNAFINQGAGASLGGFAYINGSSNVVEVGKYDNSAFSAGGTREIFVNGTIEFA